MIQILVHERCLGCGRLRTKQLDKNSAITFCKDGALPNETCFRNTEFTD